MCKVQMQVISKIISMKKSNLEQHLIISHFARGFSNIKLYNQPCKTCVWLWFKYSFQNRMAFLWKWKIEQTCYKMKGYTAYSTDNYYTLDWYM
jgi:hypothetical protein